MSATTALLPVPVSCRHRLTTHYGPAANRWLDRIPSLLGAAAVKWGLTLQGYHDAGHASALALAIDASGVLTLLKAWFDPERHHREVAALQLWHSGPASVVIASDPANSVAALRLVGSQPGGTTAPPLELSKVADAIGTTHAVGHPVLDGPFPSLNTYITEELLPRILHRHRRTRYAGLAAESIPCLERLPSAPGMETVLHADLYRENVAFDMSGNPVLLDPLPMRGNALFDWAFWSVYYRLGQGTVRRLRLAVQRSGADTALLLQWCLLLSVDGLLYYEETVDPRADIMAVVLRRLIECLRGRTMTTILLRHASMSYSTRDRVSGNPVLPLPLTPQGETACLVLRDSGVLSGAPTRIASTFPRTQQTAHRLGAAPT